MPAFSYASAELLPPAAGDHWAEKEAVKIQLPAPIMKHLVDAELVVELDAFDITEMLTQEGDSVVYTPLQALQPGMHEMRLVYFSANGDVEEIAAWQLEVRISEVLQSYTVTTDSQLSAIYRADEKNLPQPHPDRMQGQGSTLVGFNATTESWQTNGQFDMFYNSSNSSYSDQRTLDVGEFLVQTDSKYAGAAIGHHSLPSRSLIMENFHRRGLSVQGKAPALHSTATGFMYASHDVTGFGEGLGISDSDNRVDGIVLESNPLPNNRQALHVSLTSLTGRHTETYDFGIFPSTSTQETSDGSAVAITAVSRLFSEHLTLNAEYAETEFDFTTSDTLAAEDDDAHTLGATFQNATDTLVWNIGAEAQEVGTFFKSLANETLVSDKKQQRSFGGIQWQDISLQAEVVSQRDNVAAFAELPTIESRQRVITAGWSPSALRTELLGTPSLSLTLSRQNQNQIHTPTGFLSSPTQNQLESINTHMQFNYTRGYWGLVLAQADYDDQGNSFNNSKTTSHELFGSYSQEARWTLTPRIKRDRTEYTNLSQVATNTEYELIASAWFIPEKFSGNLEYRLNHNELSNDLLDEKVKSMTAALDWVLRQSRTNRPGLSLSLSGQFNEYDDRIFPQPLSEDHQIFITLASTLPTEHGN